MKSPMPRSRRSDAPFSKDEQIWLIFNSQGKTATQLRRAYIRHFRIKNKHLVPPPNAFKQVVARFADTGGVTGSCKPDEFRFSQRTPENIERVRIFFEKDGRQSVKEAMQELGLSFGTIWRILRFDLHWKPYKVHMTNRLTPDNCTKRETFCQWILSKPDGFLHKVGFSNPNKTKGGEQKVFYFRSSGRMRSGLSYTPRRIVRTRGAGRRGIRWKLCPAVTKGTRK